MEDVCVSLDEKGIFEKDMYQSKEDLKNTLLIIEKPRYQSGLYGKYIEFIKDKIK